MVHILEREITLIHPYFRKFDAKTCLFFLIYGNIVSFQCFSKLYILFWTSKINLQSIEQIRFVLSDLTVTKFISLLRIQTIKKRVKTVTRFLKRKGGKKEKKCLFFNNVLLFWKGTRNWLFICLAGKYVYVRNQNAWFVYIIHDDWSSCLMVTALGRENVYVKTQITDGLLILWTVKHWPFFGICVHRSIGQASQHVCFKRSTSGWGVLTYVW